MLQGCSARAGFGADAPAFGRVGGLDVCHNVTATLRGGDGQVSSLDIDTLATA